MSTKGKEPEPTDAEKAVDELRKQTLLQSQQLMEAKKRPIQTKRKTLNDFMNQDDTHVALLQVANASYNQEIEKFNKGFSIGDSV